MATSIIGKGDAEGLRRVEKDVLIMKKVRDRAFVLCSDLVKEFEDCVRGRTISAAWKCRSSSKEMKTCLANHVQDKELYDKCKKEYLEERERFRASGERPKKMKRA